MTTREAILAYLGDQHRRNAYRTSTLEAIQKGAKRRLGGVCPPILDVASVVSDLMVESRAISVLHYRGSRGYRLRVAGDA